MQRAQSLPAGRIVAKISGSDFGAGLPHLLQAAKVARQLRISTWQKIDDGPRQGSAKLLFTCAKQHPIALFVARDQARFRHQFQVAADPRLALAEDLGKLTDVEFAV